MTSEYQNKFDTLRQYTRDFEELRSREDLSFECDIFHGAPEFLFSFDIQVEDGKTSPTKTPAPRKKISLLKATPKQKPVENKFPIASLTAPIESNKILRKNGPLIIQFGKSDLDSVDILFLSHTWSKDTPEDLFESGDGLLVQKMISAMKIKGEKFAYGVLNLDEQTQHDLDFFDNLSKGMTELVHGELFRLKPKVVVCFGSIISNILSGKRERISRVRGVFTRKTISYEGEDFSTSYVPVFHPEFLTINPNMKRLAWEDLQKVMEHIE
ncbi:MAG: hypothetical protein ACO20H_13450 [Bacteriovoracaceae bacterium]